MSKKDQFDIDDDEAMFVKIKGDKRGSQPKPTRKTSYERSEEVQRWLKEQGSEESIVKAPFNPTFLASSRDSPWIMSSLTQFYEDDLITDVLQVVKSGKEATVYCCSAHPGTGLEFLAAKVYRPRMFRSLRNDAIYRRSRIQRDLEGKVMRGSRGSRGGQKYGDHARTALVSAWIGYEYETHCLLYNAGADVPKPLAQQGNAVLMEYIGAPGEPAPLLREVTLNREEAQPLFEQVLANIELLLANNRIHGDLSEYNMLYWDGRIYLIDFAQAVDPRYNLSVFTLFERDIERVCRYFARYGINADAHAIARQLWKQYMIAFYE